MKNIVIAGAGFGGLSCALELNRIGKDISITLVDRHDYHLFTPNLFEVASSDEEFTSVTQLKKSVAIPLAEILEGTPIRLVRGSIRGVDRKRHRLVLENKELEYDRLVLALGSEAEFHEVPGAREFALPLKSLTDAFRIRNKIEFIAQTQQLSVLKLPIRVVIAGGGYAAVELAGELASLLNVLAWKYGLVREKMEILIVEGAYRLLPGMDERAGRAALARLSELGVRVQLSAIITKVTEHFAELANGERIHHDVLIWAAGSRSVLPKFDLVPETDSRGSLVVNGYLQSVSDHDIFAVGDQCGAFDVAGRRVPGTARNAAGEGRYAARALWKLLHNIRPQPFTYVPHGFAVNIGGKWAVLKNGHMRASGWWAYVMDKLEHFRYYRSLLGFQAALKHVWLESELYSRND